MDDVREGYATNKDWGVYRRYACRGEVVGFGDNRKQKNSSY